MAEVGGYYQNWVVVFLEDRIVNCAMAPELEDEVFEYRMALGRAPEIVAERFFAASRRNRTARQRYHDEARHRRSGRGEFGSATAFERRRRHG